MTYLVSVHQKLDPHFLPLMTAAILRHIYVQTAADSSDKQQSETGLLDAHHTPDPPHTPESYQSAPFAVKLDPVV